MRSNFNAAGLCLVVYWSLFASIQAMPTPLVAGLESPMAKRCCLDTSEPVYDGRVAPTWVSEPNQLAVTPSEPNTHIFVPPKPMRMEYGIVVPTSALPAPIMSKKAGPTFKMTTAL